MFAFSFSFPLTRSVTEQLTDRGWKPVTAVNTFVLLLQTESVSLNRDSAGKRKRKRKRKPWHTRWERLLYYENKENVMCEEVSSV